MAEIERSSTIAASTELIWVRLADFGAISAWAPNVDHSWVTSERTEGVGTTRRVQVGRNAVLERVVSWEPGHRLGYAIEGLPPVVRSVTNTWVLRPDGDRTHVTITTDIDTGPRPPQQLIARAIGRRFAQASEQMLHGLGSAVTTLEATP